MRITLSVITAMIRFPYCPTKMEFGFARIGNAFQRSANSSRTATERILYDA